ncbi:hypothetical protein DFR76_1011041 [Nocardia pseudobrasiliensis]|uniref:Uncharacterized protein n=1 Tax=Nocardia pseudobrasiliensis TaxID=45979 RepID=A0A370IFV6_9NOCA|nr:hypothetical protein DFR76_1011041 [Nocardia pseudobrasiliensis]
MFWWFFVIATLLAGGVTWLGDFAEGGIGHGFLSLCDEVAPTGGWFLDLPQGYAEYLPGDALPAVWASTSLYSLVGFVIVVVAALVEALCARQPVAGLITVAVPFLSTALIAVARPGGYGGLVLAPLPAFGLILIAVAIREMWARALAPTAQPAGQPMP